MYSSGAVEASMISVVMTNEVISILMSKTLVAIYTMSCWF